MIREKGEALSPVKKSIETSGAILLHKEKDYLLYAGLPEFQPVCLGGGGERKKQKSGGGGSKQGKAFFRERLQWPRMGRFTLKPLLPIGRWTLRGKGRGGGG